MGIAKKLGLRCCAALLVSWSASALSTPVILGSDYNLSFLGAGGTTSFTNIVFDGAAQGGFVRNGVNVTINEAQADLGGGNYQIRVTAFGDGDLFASPTPGPAGANLGFAVNPLALDGFYRLTSAIVRVFDASGALLVGGESITAVGNPNPWDGYWPTPVNGYPIAGGGNAGIHVYSLEFRVSRIPLPSTLALVAVGLAAFGLRRRVRAGS